MTPERKSAESHSTRAPIEHYMGQFNIDWDHDLKPEDLVVFFAARRLEPIVRDLKSPLGNTPDSTQENILSEQESERKIENTRYTDDESLSATFSNSMDVGLVTRPEDIKDVIPTEWLLEDQSPELFYERLIDGQLLKREWRDAQNNPEDSYESVKDKDITESPSAPETEKQHSYVLLDISKSMTESGDRRDVIAQALTLAFLRQGHEERAQLAFRPFHGLPLPLSSGKTRADLKDITLRILHDRHWGGSTEIQLALEQAVKDIHKGGDFAKADILLISDGKSRLTRNPLGNIKLHTLFLGDTDFDPKLPDWSTTFKRLDAAELYLQALPSKEDVNDLQLLARSIMDRKLKAMQSDHDVHALSDQINFLTKLFESYDATEDAGVQQNLKLFLLRETFNSLRRFDLRKILKANQVENAEQTEHLERQKRLEELQQKRLTEHQAELEQLSQEESQRLLDVMRKYDPNFVTAEDNKDQVIIPTETVMTDVNRSLLEKIIKWLTRTK